MGFLKKLTRPISRVLDKIVPNEIKPALPFLAAAAPFFGPTSGIMGTGIKRLLAGGGLNLAAQLAQEGSEGDFNPLSVGIASLMAGATDPGASSYLQSLKSPTGDFAPARTGLQKFTDSALDLGIKGVDKLQGLQAAVADKGILSLEGAKLASIPATQGTMDLAFAETNRLNKQQIIDDALGGLGEGATDADRALAIRLAMQQYGFGEDEIEETITSAGYRAGGRVGFSGGGRAKDFFMLREEALNNGDDDKVLEIESDFFKEFGIEMPKTMQDGGIIGLQVEMIEGKKDGGLMDLGGKEMDLRGGGFVPIGKKEKADDVPARLSKNEFVMTADAVRAAGGGSVNKGAKRMYDLMDRLEARA